MTRPTRIRDEEDDEVSQFWANNLDDELKSVVALRLRDENEWPWRIELAVAEFLREEPLESEYAAAVTASLRAVRGVKEVEHEDREVWVVAGRARGRALVSAVSDVLERLGPRIRQHLDQQA